MSRNEKTPLLDSEKETKRTQTTITIQPPANLRESFKVFPPELIKHLLSFLKLTDLNRLICSCKTFKKSIQNTHRQQYIKEIKALIYQIENGSFKQKLEIDTQLKEISSAVEKALKENNSYQELKINNDILEEIKINFLKELISSIEKESPSLLVSRNYIETSLLKKTPRLAKKEPGKYCNTISIGSALIISKKLFRLSITFLMAAFFLISFSFSGYNEKINEIPLEDCKKAANETCSNFKECLPYFPKPTPPEKPCDFFEKDLDSVSFITIFMATGIMSLFLIEIFTEHLLKKLKKKYEEKEMTKKIASVASSIFKITINSLSISLPISILRDWMRKKGEESACYNFCNPKSAYYLDKNVSPLCKPFFNFSPLLASMIVLIAYFILHILLDTKLPNKFYRLIDNFLLIRKLSSTLNKLKKEKEKVASLKELEEKGIDLTNTRSQYKELLDAVSTSNSGIFSGSINNDPEDNGIVENIVRDNFFEDTLATI